MNYALTSKKIKYILPSTMDIFETEVFNKVFFLEFCPFFFFLQQEIQKNNNDPV